MTHDDVRDLVSAVADGEAPGGADLDAHLAGCAECAAYAAGVARLGTLAAALPRPAAPSTLPARVDRRVRRFRLRRWLLRLAPALAVATAVAVVATNVPAGPVTFPMPPAAAAEPLLHLRSLYVERTIGYGAGVTREKVWWRAPASVRIETTFTHQDGSTTEVLVVETPGERWADRSQSINRPPTITLPEPLSPTVALVGRPIGPGPVVAGLPTQAYEIDIGGDVRTAYVADGLTLGGRESLVVGKIGQDGITKTTQVVRVNPDLPDELFARQSAVARDAGFREQPLDTLAIAPPRLPEGYDVVRSGRGRDGEAYLVARGSLPVLVADGGHAPESRTARRRILRHEGREYGVLVDLYAPPAVEIETAAGVLTVSAPLPPESLVALAVRMYAPE